MKRIVGKFIYTSCSCGEHLVDLFDVNWNDKKLGFYSCNSCKQPLLVRGDDGNFYLVGKRV